MSNIFDRIAGKTSKEAKHFVNKSFDIADQIHVILENKGMSQKQLAKELDKSEPEISKWLSGAHNFTLKSIVKLELILGQDVLVTPLSFEKKIDELRNKAHSLGISSRVNLIAERKKFVVVKKSILSGVVKEGEKNRAKQTPEKQLCDAY